MWGLKRIVEDLVGIVGTDVENLNTLTRLTSDLSRTVRVLQQNTNDHNNRLIILERDFEARLKKLEEKA